MSLSRLQPIALHFRSATKCYFNQAIPNNFCLKISNRHYSTVSTTIYKKNSFIPSTTSSNHITAYQKFHQSRRTFFSYDNNKDNLKNAKPQNILDSPDLVHPPAEELVPIGINESLLQPQTQLQMQMQLSPKVAKVKIRTGLRERENE